MSFRQQAPLPGATCTPGQEVLVIFKYKDIRFQSQMCNAFVRYGMGVQVFDAGEVLQAIELLTGGKRMPWQLERTGVEEKQCRRWG
jgi:hypothetical protein